MIKKPQNEYGFISLDEEEDENEVLDSDEDSDKYGFVFAEGGEEDTDEDEIANNSEQEEHDLENQDEVDSESEEEPGFWKSVADHPVTQAGLGLAKRWTWPLDVFKLVALGEGLSGIDELEEAFRKAGKPFDREKYIEAVYEAASLFPTQSMLEDKVKDWTGADLAPKDTFSKIVRTGTEIASGGPKNILSQGPKQAAKVVAKRTAAGFGGAAVGEVAKELGVPEPIADIFSSILGGAAGGKKEPFRLTGQAKKNRKTAKKHGLRKFQGMEREKPLKNAIVSPKAQKKAAEELGDTSKKAIDKIIADKIPITKQRAMGIDLEHAYTKAYDQSLGRAKALDKANAVAKKAGKKTKEIDLQPILTKIKQKIKKIQNSAPSLSPTDKVAIKELRKQYKQLSKAPKAQTPIYGPNGQVLNPKPKGRTPKAVNGEQALDQYKNFNEETKGIYRKAEFTGNEEVVRNLYEELKSDLIEAIEKASPELGGDLKFANKIFHQTSKLNRVESLIAKAFENGYDPKKLNRVLGSKRNRAFLERDLGKGAVQEMQDIAKYGIDAERQVLKTIKNPKTAMEFLNESPLKLSLLFKVGKHGLAGAISPYAVGATLAYDVSKAIIQRVKGALMLKDSTRKSYSDFLKHAISPESPAFKNASQKLTKAIEEEYGSEKEFLKFLEEDEHDNDE
jgi:hypothetical protein